MATTKTIKAFWGDVEIIEVSKATCKAVLNGEELCRFRCSINDDDMAISRKFNAALDKKKREAYYD